MYRNPPSLPKEIQSLIIVNILACICEIPFLIAGIILSASVSEWWISIISFLGIGFMFNLIGSISGLSIGNKFDLRKLINYNLITNQDIKNWKLCHGLLIITFFVGSIWAIIVERKMYKKAVQAQLKEEEMLQEQTILPNKISLPNSQSEIESKLNTIETLYKNGKMTEQEYQNLRKEILNSIL